MFVLFFFTTLSTYKQCYQKLDVLHHLRFTVKHNTASAPPTFPWCAPSQPWFPTLTRAFFFFCFLFFHKTCETFERHRHWTLSIPSCTRRRQNGLRTDAHDWKNITVQTPGKSCDRAARPAKGKGDKFVACLWGDAALQQIHGLWSFDLYSEFFFFKARRTTTAAHRITRQHVYCA